jgi:hypothetical protein
MQRKWKKDKEKGRWIKKVESGKETQRETQEKKYEWEGTSKKDKKTTKVGVLYWNVEGLRKKRRRILGPRETI